MYTKYLNVKTKLHKTIANIYFNKDLSNLLFNKLIKTSICKVTFPQLCHLISTDVSLHVERPQLLSQLNILYGIIFQWIPPHISLMGNETTDHLVKKGSRMPC